jgi:hypothetical protein
MPLPTNLRYGSKVESAPAQSFRQTIPPNGPTYGYALGDTIEFLIPTKRNLVMVPSESYWQFDFKITNSSGAASTYRLDSCGIHGLVQKVKEVHGSNTLFELDNYGNFAKMLYDLQSPLGSTYGKQNVLTGSRNDFVATYNAPAIAAGAAVAAVTNYLPAIQINSGELLGSLIAANASTTTRTYCVNLISLTGALCPRNYLPLFAMTSAPLRLNITLVDTIAKFCASTLGTLSTHGTISISNIQFVAQFITLSDEAMNEVLAAIPDNRLEFPITSYKNFISTTTGLVAGSQLSIPVPAKYSSLKSIILTQREGTGLNTKFPFSTVVNQLASYQFKIGPNTFPSSAPSKLPEMFAEVLKCFGSIADTKYNPNIDYITYIQDVNTALTDTNFNMASSGSFYIGIDLEGYPDAPKDQVFAGYNSTTDDTYIYLTYSSTTAPTITAPRFDIYVSFDAVFVCKDDVAYLIV